MQRFSIYFGCEQVRETNVRVVATVQETPRGPEQQFAGLGLNKKLAQLAASKCALRRLKSYQDRGHVAA
jgi:hypothetical protein